MSMADIKSNMHQQIEALFAQTTGNSSDAECKAALRQFIQANYSSLSSLAWYLGADGKVIQDEAVAASEIADEAFFEIDREREFECPAFIPVYSTLNHAAQGIAR
ncbi:hypothetical protein B9J07_12895 [Sinorhizobium sp. LM21]|uniref:hypothetical protein n=1 Tax=Sinorhizobium phage phiLM21 TaxID=1524882 RepID=UPI0004E5DC82|nr:hypothetical protein AWJ26_gp17 [Sinorhizobium phage phiLM21]AII27769.1 hypothetical protein phiLM21_p017 [Sinorhizobium phage phiLM21]OWZ93533.1 hypothetical protein B9J07_12895 [Sinorhizobium sp. LM21]